MASKGGTTRQPLEQLKEMEKEGRIRRFLWDVVTLRVFAYVLAQPASFVFILSLVLITLSMPPIALYIKNADQLPDLDTMRVSMSMDTTPRGKVQCLWRWARGRVHLCQLWYVGNVLNDPLCLWSDVELECVPGTVVQYEAVHIGRDV